MIKSLLKPQCEKCEHLEPETHMAAMYGICTGIISREISVDCRHRTVCDIAEKRGIETMKQILKKDILQEQ